MIARRPALAIAAGLILGLWLVGAAKAAEQVDRFDGYYTGTVVVTSVRSMPCGRAIPCGGAIPCGTKDFTPSITIVDGVVSLVYLPGSVGKSVVLIASISRGGMFAGEGKGKFTINMSGTVSRDHIAAKAWAWDCEYALNMRKSDKPGAAIAPAIAQK
jgi:hypothetical protein